MGGQFTKDLFQKNILQEFCSPMLDERDLDDEEPARLDTFSVTLKGGLLADQGIPGLRNPEKETEDAQKMGFS
jgi:hypothetical protein